MPLSEHEQKMLEQMEQALAAEDPRFASQMQGAAVGSVAAASSAASVSCSARSSSSASPRRSGSGSGFAVMVLAAAYALTPPSGQGRSPAGPDGPVDQRWERRQNDH